MYNGPGRRDIRARSVTFVVWVAEKRIVWRSEGEVRIYFYSFYERTFWQHGDDVAHLLFETYFKYTICFVDDQGFKVPPHEAFRILKSKFQTHPQPKKYKLNLPSDDPTTSQA